MNYKQIRNPIWVNQEHTIINCEVDFDDLIEEFVPFSATLTDKYPHVIEIFQKCANGDFGTVQEYVEPIIPEPTQEELKALFIASIQNLLDSKAKEKNYDSILSACSYAGYDNPFRAEGEAYGVWRASCWQTCYQMLADVEAGTRPMPTIEEVLTEMPLLVLL